MSSWQNPSFLIPRQSDRQIVQSVQQAFSEADIKIETATFTLMVGGPQISGSGDQVLSQGELKSILDTNTQSIRDFSFLFANGQLSLGIVRNEGQLRDNVTLHLKNLNQDPAIIKFIKREKLIALVVLTKQHLKELNAQTQLDIIGPQIREHYEIREAELAKLESTLTRIQEEFGRNVAQQRQELESEFKKRREELEQETKELKEQIALQHEQREKELEQEGEKLKKRLAEIDDRESRYVRREIRKDIKNELKNRSEKFQLTEGTRKLRSPIFWFSIVLLVLFGSLLILFSVETFREIISGNAVSTARIIAISVRQAAFAIAFGSTAVFFIRWNNRWFEQHASEEFKLKRLELDLERASWVVEMALEWKDEKGTEIPAELIDRLTVNLFGNPQEADSAIHPADQLASALLGSSAEATVNLPGGNSLRLDRKSIRDLKKSSQE